MLKHNKSTIKSNSIENKIKGSVRLDAGSFVIDNQWVSYDNYLFKMEDYLNTVITANRPNFFNDRNNAVALIVTLSIKEGIKIIEGNQVTYTSREAVPLPQVVGSIPLIGIIVRQDGTSDLNSGYKALSDNDLLFFSGTGNIEDKNLVGLTGLSNTAQGLTGLIGDMGSTGASGITGPKGFSGETGLEGPLIQGETGVRGMTGISWDVNLPFRDDISNN
jgi:hypothetical protein